MKLRNRRILLNCSNAALLQPLASELAEHWGARLVVVGLDEGRQMVLSLPRMGDRHLYMSESVYCSQGRRLISKRVGTEIDIVLHCLDGESLSRRAGSYLDQIRKGKDSYDLSMMLLNQLLIPTLVHRESPAIFNVEIVNSLTANWLFKRHESAISCYTRELKQKLYHTRIRVGYSTVRLYPQQILQPCSVGVAKSHFRTTQQIGKALTEKL